MAKEPHLFQSHYLIANNMLNLAEIGMINDVKSKKLCYVAVPPAQLVCGQFQAYTLAFPTHSIQMY